MKRIVFLPVVFVAMSIQLVRSAEAPALIERPASGNGPTQVSVGIWVVDINNIDSAQQNFTADIAVVLRWKDARLAHTGCSSSATSFMDAPGSKNSRARPNVFPRTS